MKSPMETTTTRPRHNRRNAIIWDDLLSLVHPETKAEAATFVDTPSVEYHDPNHDDSTISSMKAEAATLDARSVLYHETPYDDQSTIASSSIDQTCCTPQPKSPSHFLDSRPPSEVYIMSPPTIKRKLLSFDSIALGDEFSLNDGDTHSSPRCISEIQFTEFPAMKSSPPRLPWLAFQSDDFDDEASLA